MTINLFPPEELIEDAAIALPLSKSLSTRTLILDALTEHPENNDGSIAACDDTAVITAALEAYAKAKPGEALTLDMQASGAALRFLTAFFAAQEGADVTLRGIARLCERPMGVLIDALRACGADIECPEGEGHAPLHIRGHRLAGGDLNIDASVSSQFISALLMVAPAMDGGLTLRFDSEPVSLPYILMTVGLMERRGISIDREPLSVTVHPGLYLPYAQAPEGDWSAAAFWMEITAVSAGWYTMTNLKADTLQGDSHAAEFFERLGVNCTEAEDGQGIELAPSPEVFGRLDLDLTDYPDLAPALVVTASLIGVPFKLTGLHSLVVKECNRLEALAEEMQKLGRNVTTIRDFGLEWDGTGHPVTEMPVMDAHGDPRMAMALAPVCYFAPGIALSGAETVSKSYPEYWDQLRELGFSLEETKATEE